MTKFNCCLEAIMVYYDYSTFMLLCIRKKLLLQSAEQNPEEAKKWDII